MSNLGVQSISTEFPFTFLHTEIVNYFKERESEQDTQRDEYFQRLEQSKNDGLEEIEQSLNRTLFLQVIFKFII